MKCSILLTNPLVSALIVDSVDGDFLVLCALEYIKDVVSAWISGDNTLIRNTF